MTPPCRECGNAERVACYLDDHAKTICIECCKTAEHEDGEVGHVFYFEPGEGHTCWYCGVNRNDTDYDYSEDFE